MTFQILALDPAPFASLFALDDASLTAQRVRRVVADAAPGFPCRVSLEDAAIGEELLLAPYQHQPAASPYRATYAVYVRRDAVPAAPAPGKVPAALRRRTLSLRAFDTDGMIVGAALVDGEASGAAIERWLGDPRGDEVHLHFAAYGCFAARARRA